MTEAVKQKPRIRYAGSGRVPYFSGNNIARPGQRGPWAEDEDNPLSSNFRSPEQRTESEKARWWALYGRKSARQTAGEFDAKPV